MPPKNPDTPAEANRFYTDEEVIKMRRAGFKKPDNLTWSQWMTPEKLSPRHNVICYLAATGLSNAKIAEQTGMTSATISRLVTNPKVRNEIQYLQRQMFGQDPKRRFNALMEDAITTIEDVMKNPEEKGATRLQAATIVKETVMGRPTQTVDLGGNMIRALFERMDEKQKSSMAIDVTHQKAQTLLPDRKSKATLEAIGNEEGDISSEFENEDLLLGDDGAEINKPLDITPEPKKEETKSALDSWIEENL